MRTLGEIIETARDGTMPTHQECYWAMLALNALSTFDSMAFSRMARMEQDSKPCFAVISHEEHFNRNKRAFAEDPKKWVGWNNDPANPEFQVRRSMARRIFDKALASSELKK